MTRITVALLLMLLLSSAVAVADEAADDIAESDVARTRPSALAGTWYPADAATLTKTVDALLAAAETEPPDGTLRALVAPHAGYAYSGATAANAFTLLRGATYRRIVLLAPAHRGDFEGLSIADVDAYETPLGPVPLDRQAIAQLRSSPLVQADPAAHSREHAIEIELPFLQRTLTPGWRLVPMLVGRLDEDDSREAAELLRPFLDDSTVLVVSTDFTHYGPRFGYVPFPADSRLPERIKALDNGAITHIEAGDAPGLRAYQDRTGITICGRRPLAVLLELLPEQGRVHRLAYATSGELTGDWTHSVSYVALAVTSAQPLSAAGTGAAEAAPAADEPQLDSAALARLHQLAQLGIGRVVLGEDQVPDELIAAAIDDLPPDLTEPAGAFVTLWRQGALRGCVGHAADDVPLYVAVLSSAANVARNDHRFHPLQPDELADLDIEVSVLTPPRPIAAIDEIQVGEHGVTVRKDGRYALYLPKVATKMGWDRETTLTQLALKAGLPADGWRDGASFEVFTTMEYRAPYTAPVGPSGAASRVSAAAPAP